MARQEIVLGTPPTGLGGDPPRVASMKINAMTLELYGAGGIGGIAGKMDRASALIADPNNTAGGFTYTPVGHASNPTELNVAFSIFTIPGSSGNNASQFAWPLTSVTANKNRVWYRQEFNNVWSPWTENITVTSMAALFGIGGTSANVTDLDVLFGTNVYRVLGTATGTPVNQAGMVQHMQYGTTVGSASAQVYITYEATPRMFYRSRPTNGVYTAWITNATLDTVEARLAFYGIGLAADAQAQSATNLNATIIPGSYRVASNASGKPGTLGGMLEVRKGFANDIKQEFTESGTSTLWVRSTTNGGATWSAWDLKGSAAATSNVDNTSDANKPISTATKAALDTKFDAAKAILDPQSAGGLMSYGSNATGEYWKFLNGLLISTQTVFGAAAAWFNPGTGIRYKDYSGSLPATFVRAPRLQVTAVDPDVSTRSAWIANAAAGVGTYQVYLASPQATTGVGALQFNILAIGSWK